MKNQPNGSNNRIGQHYTVTAIAKVMGVSGQTTTKLLENEEGIVRIGHRGLQRTKVTIRVPESAWKRIYDKWKREGLDGPGRKLAKPRDGSTNGRK